MSQAQRLRALLERPGLLVMPCCFDAFSARLIEAAGFSLTFLSGFGVSATRIGRPDAGLLSFGELREQAWNVCRAVDIPVLVDADTGYGDAPNVRRTVRELAALGAAAVMIEDQEWPKRCGHVAGKRVVDAEEARRRIRAAVDAREEGADVLIIARTDARATHGLDEALRRLAMFAEEGADILFLEGPESLEELAQVCAHARKPAMANMVEGGLTPLLPPSELEALGFRIAAFPLTLLSAAARAMGEALADLRAGRVPAGRLLSFGELKELVGFPAYEREAARYRGGPDR